MKMSIIWFALVLFSAMLIFHETTHYVIAKEYHCDDITLKANFATGIYISAYDCNQGVELPQAINEIVGYNIIPMLIIIILSIVGIKTD